MMQLQWSEVRHRESMESERTIEGYDPSGVIETQRTGYHLLTEPLLNAMNIPIWRLTNPTDIPRRLRDAQTLAHASLHPVAVLLSRELMWEE